MFFIFYIRFFGINIDINISQFLVIFRKTFKLEVRGFISVNLKGSGRFTNKREFVELRVSRKRNF